MILNNTKLFKMKLRLVNFRCYSDKTFEFDDDSLTLISGESGCGKSTLLIAIQFALYGTGKKLQSYGKSSCTVELILEGFHIIRTKTPNRLILNDDYEDEVAQNIINKKFGDMFEVTSYISQNPINSFILMNPTDKLEFLEKFAFKDINLPLIKEKAKKLITDKNDELNKTTSKLETLLNVLNEMQEPEEVGFPFKCSRKLEEKYKTNEEVKNRNCGKILKKSKILISKTQNELNELNILTTYINSKQDHIDSLIEQIEEVGEELESNKTSYEGNETLSEYKKRLKKLLSVTEFSKLEKKFKEDSIKLEEMKQHEIENYTKEINEIEEELEKLSSKEEMQESISTQKELLKDAKEITFLRKQIKKCISKDGLEKHKNRLKDMKEELEDKKKQLKSIENYSVVYPCPSCKSKLCFRENKLCVNDVEQEVPDNINIKELKKDISSLELDINTFSIIRDEEQKMAQNEKIQKEIDDIVSQYEEDAFDEFEIQKELESLERDYKKYTRLEDKKYKVLNILEKGDFSSSFKLFKKNLEELELELKMSNLNIDSIDEELSEDELRNIINNQQKYNDTIIRLERNIRQLEDEKKKFQKQIEDKKQVHIEKYESVRKIKELEEIINENEEIILQTEDKKEKCLENLEQIEKYYKYREEQKKYYDMEKKVEDLQEKEKECRKRYTAACLFKEKIAEAESIAMYSIIESINAHAQEYIEYFFAENPMSVRLLSFKETKKGGKPQINIEIEYKGNECDLSNLSGGEVSRVVLAFTLALGEMFNTKLLLLDECTASLNQEQTTVVFDTIKENFKDKTVIIVAHQIITGIFDSIISL